MPAEGVASGPKLTGAAVQAGQHLDMLVHGAASFRRRTSRQGRAEASTAERQKGKREQSRVDDRATWWGVEQELIDAWRASGGR